MTHEELQKILKEHELWLEVEGGSLADLREADLRGADLSEAKGLPSSIDFLAANFEKTEQGYIAYKTFNEEYATNPEWVIKEGSVITENVNYHRTEDCGCGVNVGTLDWVKQNTRGNRDIWKVLICWEWLSGVCVPYASNGKIRCERGGIVGGIL